MAQVDLIRNNSVTSDEKIKLTKEQQLMLEMSENDISNNRLMTQSELDKSDLEWLKTK
jgi:hypothetical protein